MQPVLDRNCVQCHAQNKSNPRAINLGRAADRAQVVRLVQQPRAEVRLPRLRREPTARIPGKFGAKASKLYEILEKGHYDVKLSQEDMHRITLWLDCCSMFYGVFEKEGGEEQLRGEIARPTLE